jgi:hypothetical protein
VDRTFSQDNALRLYSNVTASVLISEEHSAGDKAGLARGFQLNVTSRPYISKVSNYANGKYTETCIKHNGTIGFFPLQPGSFLYRHLKLNESFL